MSVRALLALAVVAGLCGCGSDADTRRWSSVSDGQGDGREVMVRVYVAPPVAGASAAPTMTSLSDRGQAALVGALAEHSRSAAAIRTAVFPTAPSAVSDSLATIDADRHLLIITLTRPGDYHPGDRIMRAVVFVQPLNFSFGGYTVAQTDRETIDITQLRRTGTITGSFTASSASALPASVGAGVNGSVSEEATTKLAERPETLTVDMVPSCLRMVQEGAHAVDITGNLRIATALLTQQKPVVGDCNLPSTPMPALATSTPRMDSLFVVDGLAFTDGRPDPKGGGALRAYPTEPLVAWVAWEYVLRQVAGDDGRYYEEGRQAVRLVRGAQAACETILPPSQMVPALYALAEPKGAPRSGEAIQIGAQKTDLVFTRWDVAEQMAGWISRTHPARFAGQDLIYDRGVVVGPVRYAPPAGVGPCGAGR